MINITNKRARQLYLVEVTRQMMRLENTQAREIKPILNRQYINAAQLVQQGGTKFVDAAVDKERARLVTLIPKHYRRVATVFGNKVFKIVEASKGINIPETKTPKDEFWSDLNLWMATQAGKKITKIQDTSKQLIAAVIQRGMQDGESHLEIAARIRATGKIATPHRARTIALTETHTAACKSIDTAIKSTRIEMEKEWLAAMDERTRPDHAAADGQRVPEKGRFNVGTSLMLYPGDPAGGAEQTVRCRCVCLYHTVKRMDELKPYEPSES